MAAGGPATHLASAADSGGGGGDENQAAVVTGNYGKVKKEWPYNM